MTAPARTEFATRYGRWALVVGASEGLGAAAADQLGARGLDLVLLARNTDALTELADDVRGRHGVEVRTVTADLTAPDAPARALTAVAGLEVGLLLYTSGAAGSAGRFTDQALDHALRMIQLNCTMPTRLVHALVPPMVERGRGAVALVGSTGAFAGQPFVSSYSAAKAFQVNLVEGLWSELEGSGVDVLDALIGSTNTPARTRRLGVRFDPAVDMTPEEVAADILDHLGDGPTRVISKGTSGIGSLAEPWARFRALAVPTMRDAMAGFTARTDVPGGS
jgi:short-subunit dehydrogenase